MALNLFGIFRNSTRWQSRTSMKLRRAIIVGVGIFLCFFLSICTGVPLSSEFPTMRTYFHNHKQRRSVNSDVLSSGTSTYTHESSPEVLSKNICNTPACFSIASKFIYNLNQNVDPCNDFGEFACGGFKQNTSIPDEKVVASLFEAISDEVDIKLREALDVPIEPDEPRHIKMSKKFYKSCMNERAIDEQGHGPLKTVLKKLGGWPVLEGNNWDASNFSWIELKNSYDKIDYSDNVFVLIEMTIDYKNNTKQVILIDQPSFSVVREFFLEGMNNSFVTLYYKYMVSVAVLLGASKAVAEEQLLESLEFERQLASISIPLVLRRDVTNLYNPMTLNELSQKYSILPWAELLNKLFAPQINIKGDEMIIVHSPQYLSDFEVLMNKTSSRTQANYALWKFVESYITHSSLDLRLKKLEYIKEKVGVLKNEQSWKKCVQTVTNMLSISVGSLYIQKYFNQEARNTAIEIFNNIKDTLLGILETVDWMGEDTRQKALEKAASVIGYIGYPDELADNNKLDNYYSNLEITDDHYFENVLNAFFFHRNYTISEFRKPYNLKDWKYHAQSTDVNAYYSFLENSIELPAAILQGMFFDADHPKYLNYGGIGFLIGHEITHGFDDEGQLFDKTGKLIDWWDTPTKEQYLLKAQCFIDQYSNYTDLETGLRVNGAATVGENIADNGGIKLAYAAYNKWISRNREEKLLPGLEFTPQQLFWISTVNVWCAKRRPKSLEILHTNDIHSPEMFRIIGVVSNMPEFAKDFNCPVGSKMNSISTCTIW